MTQTGVNRERYDRTHRDTDPRPSRFLPNRATYSAWAARADAWAADAQIEMRTA